MNYTKGERRARKRLRMWLTPEQLDLVFSDPFIATAPEMYEVLKRFEQLAIHSGQFTPPDLLIACGNVLAKVEGGK